MKIFKKIVRPCISEAVMEQHAEINRRIEDSSRKLSDFVKQAWADLDARAMAKTK